MEFGKCLETVGDIEMAVCYRILARRSANLDWPGGKRNNHFRDLAKGSGTCGRDVENPLAAMVQHRSTGTLNIATGRSVSFREVAEMIAALSSPVEIRGTPRQNPITHRHFDITDCLKAFPEFHYIPLRDGLTRVAKEGA